MIYEISAGGVIVSRQKNQLQVLLIKDKNAHWTFPKGLIEKGEKKETTAAREIAEEVGIKNLKLLSPLTPVQYLYKWNGDLRKKTVHYYLFQNGGEEHLTPQLEEGIMEVKWFAWEEAKKVVGYPKTNKRILKEAEMKLPKQINHKPSHPRA